MAGADTVTNILHLAYSNAAGVPSRWAQAHQDAGHSTRLVLEVEDEFGYSAGHTVLRWSNGSQPLRQKIVRLEDDLGWADALMVYDHPFYLDAAKFVGKPTIYRALGSGARTHPRQVLEGLRWQGVRRATTGTADLAIHLGIELSGAPYQLLEPAAPRGKYLIAHAPSDKDGKGTATIVAAADAAGWKIDVIEGTPNREVLERKRKANVVVDQFGGSAVGYGVNGVEAMAMGLPVIGQANSAVKDSLSAVGSPAIIVKDASELLQVLKRVKKAGGFDPQVGRDGRDFVARFHDGSERARQDSEALA